MASQRTSTVLCAALRSSALSVEKRLSMGCRAGTEGGRERKVATSSTHSWLPSQRRHIRRPVASLQSTQLSLVNPVKMIA